MTVLEHTFGLLNCHPEASILIHLMNEYLTRSAISFISLSQPHLFRLCFTPVTEDLEHSFFIVQHKLVWESLGPHLCYMQLGVFFSFIKFKIGPVPGEWWGWAGLTIVLSHTEMGSGSLSLLFCEQIGCLMQEDLHRLRAIPCVKRYYWANLLQLVLAYYRSLLVHRECVSESCLACWNVLLCFVVSHLPKSLQGWVVCLSLGNLTKALLLLRRLCILGDTNCSSEGNYILFCPIGCFGTIV